MSISKVFLQIIFSAFMLLACTSQQQETPSTRTGGVASAHPLATKAGLEVMEKGGNAYDAAIAVAATLNVVEPMMSGLGGYGTILVYDAEKKRVRFLNSSGRFPINTDTDLMRAPTPDYMKNRIGPKSISTPGNLNAWKAMHEAYGNTPWNQLFTSAINHAENGFPISSALERWIEIAYEDFSAYTKAFYGPNGEPLNEGESLVQSDLAKTFKIIQDEGVDPFYRGTIAQAIDQRMSEVGSFLSLEDLQRNEAEWWEPYRFSYKGFDVFTASLPANSFPAFVNLGIMQEYDDENLQHNSVDYLHRFAEMTKESYKSRLAYSFDPEIQDAPIDSILSATVLTEMANALDKEKATQFVPPFSPNSQNTTHFVVVDRWGNIVSATQTLGNLFGSRVMVEGTGVFLNNSMAYATYEPKGNPMDAFPGRHKLSGDCPVIILKEGQPWAALGSPGGHTITQNVPQIIFNLIDFNMTMQEAIDAPKISFVEPDMIYVDQTLPEDIISGLEAKGHKIGKGNIGNAHGIRILYNEDGSYGGLEGGSDRRGEGTAGITGIN